MTESPNPPSPLLKADSAMIAFSATSDGSLRVRYSSWEDAKVFRPGESLELVARQRAQVLDVRKLE